MERIRLEPLTAPTPAALERYTRTVLPVLRHVNDLRAAINVLEARPDWVLSTNTAHWGPALGAGTDLRVASPWEFLEHLLGLRP